MAGIFDNYEHQFSTIIADITARIGKIPNLVGSECPISHNIIDDTIVFFVAEKKTAIGVVQGNIDEAGELVIKNIVIISRACSYDIERVLIELHVHNTTIYHYKSFVVFYSLCNSFTKSSYLQNTYRVIYHMVYKYC